MKALYVVALVMTIVFIGQDIYFINEYQEAYSNYLWGSIYSYESSFYNSDYYEMYDITFNAAALSAVFLAFFVLLYAITIAKIKRTTAKVISIIGVSVVGLFFLLTFVPLSSPGGASWNEFGPVLILVALIILAFNIVNLVQAVRFGNQSKSNPTTVDDLA